MTLPRSPMVSLAAMASVLAMACGGTGRAHQPIPQHRSAPGSTETGPSSEAPGFSASRVFLLTSSAPCSDGPSNDIKPRIEADALAFKKLFRDATVLNPAQFIAEAKQPLAASTSDQPVVFFYAGHGVSRPENDGQKESRICLPGAELPFRTIANWVRSKTRVSLIILNSCESADVDPSVEGLGEMSVISASIDRTMDGSVGPEETTPVTSGLMTLLARTSWDEADRNCDAIVTDQELFEALDDELRVQSWRNLARASGTQVAVPNPKLRRNADKPLAILRTNGANSPGCLELLKAFAVAWPHFGRHRATLLDRRRHPGRDYFVVTDRDGVILSKTGCAGLSKQEALVCRAFQEELEPLPLPPGTTELATTVALARGLAEQEIYEARVDAPWVEIIRLRSELTTTVTTVERIAAAVPQRRRTVQHALDGSVHRLYTGKVCRGQMATFQPRPIPCAVGSGQCFWLNRQPVGLEDACEE